MLSRRFSLSLIAFVGVLLLAASAPALTLTYSVTGTMDMTNSQCTPALCNVPVSGTMTMSDDEVGNVAITAMSLNHVGYQVATPALVSVVIARSAINLSTSVLGTGTTLSGATAFGSDTINQFGSITCTAGLFPCLVAGFSEGVNPLPLNPTPSPTAFGTFNFDAGRNFVMAFPLTFTNVATPNPALERLSLTGTLTNVPEPGTALLLAGGLLGMALRRRAVR